jgi:hypothetical protein
MNNDPADPSTQAPADGAVVNPANPYVGTRFVAGTEDAVDVYANRPHNALSWNTDQLDNAIRRGIAKLERITWTVGAPTDTFSGFDPGTLVWTGAGVPAQNIELVRQSDMSNLVTSVGGKVQASSWVVAADDAAGFGEITSVTFNETIPAGTYYVFYGAKTAVAELDRDAMFAYLLHGIPQIAPKVQVLFQQLHAPVGSAWQQLWDDAWGTTIEELARSGLNERYGRSHYANALMTPNPYDTVTAVDNGWPLSDSADTPGSGGWILRRGPAPTVVSNRVAGSPLLTDKLNACWRTVMSDAYATHGGSVGVAIQGARPLFDDSHQRGPGLAAQLTHRPCRMQLGEWYSTDGWTVIPDGGNASVTYGTVGGNTELVCTLTDVGAHFFLTSGGNYTAITTGMDMLELVDPADGTAKFWVINQLTDATHCTLRQLNGDLAPVGKANGGYVNGSPTTVTVTWHTPISSTSDGAAERQLQVACANSLYDPGYLALPAPINYGTVFMAGLPYLGLTENMSTGQIQQFDQSVVSIFGSVVGGSPVPHPDTALRIGCRSATVDPLGQSAPTVYATILSNGFTYLPKLFVGAIGMYDVMAEDITVESSLLFPGVGSSIVLQGNNALLHLLGTDAHLTMAGIRAALSLSGNNASITMPGSAASIQMLGAYAYIEVPTVVIDTVETLGSAGLLFQTDRSNNHNYMQLSADMAQISLSSDVGQVMLNYQNATTILEAKGGIGYGFCDTLGFRNSTVTHKNLEVNVESANTDVYVDVRLTTTLNINKWDYEVNAANLHIKLLGAGLLADPDVNNGYTYRLCVYFDPEGSLPVQDATLTMTFEAGDSAVSVGTAGPYTLLYDSDTSIPLYYMRVFDVFVGLKLPNSAPTIVNVGVFGVGDGMYNVPA